MGVFIDRLLGFKDKPVDGSAVGIPLSDRDQLFLEVHAATLPTTIPTLSVNVTTYDPATGQSSTTTPVRFLVAANDYSLETASTAPTGTFSNGEILTTLTVTSSASVPSAGRCHVSVFLFRRGILYAQLIGDFITDENVPTWIAGQPSHDFKNAFYDENREPALFTFQGTVVNGAGGAGDQTLTITPAAGSRIRMLSATIDNGDTANRVADIQILDPSNRINILMTGTINAANSCSWPNGSAQSATSNGAGIGPSFIAGSNTYQFRVIAVAASENSAFAFTAAVYGGAPTCTLAGASTPTLTTNTSRFEAG